MNFIKNKRFILVASAIVFLVLLFLFKNGMLSTNGLNNSILYDNSSISGNDILQDLVNKDTDGDGILDWEESLWGTDPKKQDTDDDGTPDSTEIAGLKSETATNAGNTDEIENLTQTDKFSRELFSTIVTLNQTGEVDQATIDKLSASLVEQIQNSAPRKVFASTDIQIIQSNTNQDFYNYNEALNKIYERHPIKNNPLEILQEFVNDGENMNVDALSKLDPIIEQTEKIIGELVKTEVPSALAQLHLGFINGLERIMENLIDLQLFDSDPIVAMGAISKYEENADLLQETMNKLADAIRKKLNN